MIDANDLIQKGSKILKKNNIITHQIDSELILSNILQTKREDLTLSSDGDQITRLEMMSFSIINLPRN